MLKQQTSNATLKIQRAIGSPHLMRATSKSADEVMLLVQDNFSVLEFSP